MNMALSPAMQWALNNGMTEADVYKNINDFLATKPDAATTQAQMAQYGISGADVANATGGTSGGMLGGNVLAGASWNSLNTALPEQLTAATGQATTNTAVGGATTADTLNQLNTFLAGGGQFDPKATVYLQTGGVDFLQGVDKGTIKDNITQIVQTLGNQGVNVVLTGSPYAASINDVVTNNFNPAVDPLFTQIAKENKNVALVGTQGEILQNKALLVDALHTNAEGTAIYNQSVIDALSQFKNEVPSSTPQAIAQVQQSNTVPVTPSVIAQAAASPVIAQSLARVIPTARGTVIEGDNIDAQIAGIPQVVYQTRVDPNNTANWETYNPKTGEVIDRGTFAGGGDKGLLAAAAPVIGLAASTIGLPGITSFLGGLTGTTGSTLAGLTGAAIGGGTNAIAGGTSEDILRAALLGGAGAFGGSELNKYLYDSTAAADLAGGLDPRYGGSNPLYGTKYDAAMSDLLSSPESQKALADYINGTTATTPVAVSTPVTDGGGVNITAPATLPATSGLTGLLSTVPSTVPSAGTVNVTGTSTPQQVDQSVLNLINSQLASNVTTPANLANVQVTGDKGLMSGNDTNTALLSALTGVPTTTITAAKPATAQEIVTAITSTLPNVTAAQATTVAEQIITSGKPVTTQEVINAITAALPSVTTPTTATTSTVPTTTITAPKTPLTTQDLVGAITATLPAVTTPTVPTSNIPTTTITAQKPTSVGDTLAAFPATLAPVTPPTTPKTNELGLTDEQMLKLLQGGLGLLGGLGGASLLGGGGTSTGVGSIPTQGTPMYNDDYFTKVQQNYNRILPAVPRDVASPLRDWYTSQYGA
jgi:hypothetical protein